MHQAARGLRVPRIIRRQAPPTAAPQQTRNCTIYDFERTLPRTVSRAAAGASPLEKYYIIRTTAQPRRFLHAKPTKFSRRLSTIRDDGGAWREGVIGVWRWQATARQYHRCALPSAYGGIMDPKCRHRRIVAPPFSVLN